MNRCAKNLFFGCAFWSFVGQAQLMPINYDTLEVKHEVIIDGGVDYYGTSVQNDMLSKFVRGGHITEEIKDNSFNRHGAINRIGGVMGGEVEYRNYTKRLFKSKDWGFNIKAGYNTFGAAIYSKDLFGAIFYGNQRYEGETMDFSGSRFTLLTYQKVGIGLISAKSKSSVSLNFYNISNRTTGDLRKAEIFQHEDGETIDITMQGQFEQTNSKKFNQGIGIGIDADFKFPVNWLGNRTAYIQFSAKNIGVAHMYEKQKVYSFDTTFTFSGFQMEDFIGESSVFQDTTFSFLDTLGISSTERNRTEMLPGFIQVAKIVDNMQEAKWQSFFGVRVYTTVLYSPYVFGGVDYRAASWLHLGANIAYGGFGKLRGGIYAGAQFKKYSVGLSSENITGWFTRNSSGQSFYIRLGCAI